MKQTTFDEFVELSRRGTFVPVWREIMADLLTPVSAFLKIVEHSDYAFLLESVEGGEHVGRYSFLGKDPFLVLRGREGETTIEQAGVRANRSEPFIDVLRGLMAEFQAPFVPELPRLPWAAERIPRIGTIQQCCCSISSRHSRMQAIPIAFARLRSLTF